MSSQDNNSNKNRLFVTYGSVIFSDQVSFSYERSIYDNKFLKTGIKLNAGRYLSNNLDYEDGAKVYNSHVSLSCIQTLSIIELNAGLAFTKFSLAENLKPSDEVRNGYLFYGNIGIRLSGEKWLFRTGIGNLELLYVGLGYQF